MNVTIRFVGYLKLEGISSGETVRISSGTTISDLLRSFNVRPEHLWLISAAVNGEAKTLNYVLQDGDELTLFMPIGGG